MGMQLRFFGAGTASLLLRFAIGVPFLVFGIGKLVDAASWVGYIPPWMTPLLPVSVWTFLTIIGVTECVLGALLLAGLWTRVVAALAALHLFGIIVALGGNEIAFRDATLLLTALALVALGPAGCHLSVDGRRQCSVSPPVI